jgi:hypothetical protein
MTQMILLTLDLWRMPFPRTPQAQRRGERPHGETPKAACSTAARSTNPAPLIGKWVAYRWQLEGPRRGWFVGNAHLTAGEVGGDGCKLQNLQNQIQQAHYKSAGNP